MTASGIFYQVLYCHGLKSTGLPPGYLFLGFLFVLVALWAFWTSSVTPLRYRRLDLKMASSSKPVVSFLGPIASYSHQVRSCTVDIIVCY